EHNIVDTEKRHHEDEIEEQIHNRDSMVSDSMTPALEEFPDVKEFDQLLKR
ncbi:hypothetical protein RJ035_005097, partial [Blastomyces gilchristii]